MISSGRYLGVHDLDAEEERSDKRGFAKGKRYFTFLLRYFGPLELIVKRDEVNSFMWVNRRDIPMVLSTTRGEKRYLILQFVEEAFDDSD